MILGMLPVALWADQNDGFSFLLLSPAVRAAAMGEAYVSIAEGGEGVYSNPAGLSFETQSHLYAQTFVPPFIEDMKSSNLAYVKPGVGSSWSVQTGVVHVGNFTRTVTDGSAPDGFRETGDFSTYDFRVSASFGKMFAPDWGFGATTSFLRQSLADETAHAVSTDFGILFKERNYPVQVGASIQNLGTKPKFRDEQLRLPALVRAGLSFHQMGEFFPKFVPQASLITADFYKLVYGSGGIRGGFELPLSRSLQLRAGYNHPFVNPELGSTLKLPNGLSFGIGLALKSFRLDFASSSLGELGLLHRISIDFLWDTGRKIQRAWEPNAR